MSADFCAPVGGFTLLGARRQAVLEGEQVCWVQRALLCKFQLEKWSLKGWGDVLLLRDLRDLTMRLVFRKDKTGAILLDHLVQSADPTMCEMRRSSSSVNCLQWRANDESIGKLRAETISMTLPCARAASEFASAFLKAKVAASMRPQGSAHIFLSAARRDQPEQLLALWCGLQARTVVIGRPPACDISVLSSKVSGVHAEISLVKQGEAWDAQNSPVSFHVRDVSSNGTIVRFPDGSERLLKQDTCRVPQGTVLVVPASGDVEQTHLVLSVALGYNDPVPPVSNSVGLGRAAAAKSAERSVPAGNRVTSAGMPKACLAGTGLQVSAGSVIRPAPPALGSPAAASSSASRTLTVGAIGPDATDSLTTLRPAGGANAVPSAGTLSASLAGSRARVSAGSEIRPARSALGSPAAASSSASRTFAGGAYSAPSADMSRASLTAGSGVQVLSSSIIRPAVVGSLATARSSEPYTLAGSATETPPAGAPGAAFPIGSGGARVSAVFDISGAIQRGLAACRAAALARAVASASVAPGGAAPPLPPKEGEGGAASPVGKEMRWMFLSNGKRGSRRKSRSEEVCGARPQVEAAPNSEGDGQIGLGGEAPGEAQRRRIRRHKRARSPQPPRSAAAGDSDEGRDAPGVDSRRHRWA
mmetsp:Transcript_123871/g.396599  ORF Transcript_123871/g.396599 Transcript_123871/m.396599 type:complete len:646 (+) Transcript_123871:35-1972(+)